MGCRVGRWVFLETTLFSEFDLVEIGDHAALNLGVTVQTHLFEDRVMKSDLLKIGSHCSIGNMSVVLYGTEMQQGSCLGSLSLLMKGETLPPSSRWFGIPTQLVDATPARSRTARSVAELG
jgi:non-ribosomal peptide synthetase-like protein